MVFKVGETVVYPHHGAALIEAIETRTIKGEERKYLVLKVAQGDLTVRVPADNAEIVGVRDVVGQEGLDRVFEVLRAPHTEEPTNWSRRYKANLEKLASGDVNKVAEVVRDLWRREKDRGLSAGEKRMLAKARQILVSELALAEGTNEEQGRDPPRRGPRHLSLLTRSRTAPVHAVGIVAAAGTWSASRRPICRRRSCRSPGRPLVVRAVRRAARPGRSTRSSSPSRRPTRRGRGRAAASARRRRLPVSLHRLGPRRSSPRSAQGPGHGRARARRRAPADPGRSSWRVTRRAGRRSAPAVVPVLPVADTVKPSTIDGRRGRQPATGAGCGRSRPRRASAPVVAAHARAGRRRRPRPTTPGGVDGRG